MIIDTDNAPKAIGPYSQAVVAGDYVYISGCCPFSIEDGSVVGTNIEEQSIQVMENLNAIVMASGLCMSNVVKTTCFIRNMEDFTTFNSIYKKYFVVGIFPARSCVEVSRLPKDVLIEVEAVLYKS